MTIETLEAYRGIVSEIQALEAELDALFEDPEADAMRATLAAKQERWKEAKRSIEVWLDTVTDAEVRSIARWHYIIGYNWKETAAKVYGRGDYYIARKRIKRYFGKE